MARSLYIIDRTLKGLGGHSLGYDLAVAEAAADLFDHVEIHGDRHYSGPDHRLIHRTLGVAGSAGLMRLVKRFVVSMSGRKAMIAPETRSFSSADHWKPVHPTKHLTQYLRAVSLSRRCRRILKPPLNRGDEVHVFLQSAEIADILAIPMLTVRPLLALDRVTIHLMLRHGPERTCSSFEPARNFMKRLSRLVTNNRLKVRLYTDTAQLRLAYLSGLPEGTEIKVLPIPIAVAATMVPEPDRGNRIRLSMLGSPRMEKGIGCLLPLLDMLPSHVEGRRLELAVQIEAVAEDEAATEIVRQLEVRPERDDRAQLLLLRGPVNESVYAEWHAHTDIALLLYTSPKYALSSSGIFAEALYLCRPCIVFSGTWMASVIAEAEGLGLCIGRAVSSLDEVPHAVLGLVADYASRSRDVGIYAREWGRTHTASRLVQILGETPEKAS